MKNFLKVICCISLLICAQQGYAKITINGEIKGSNITWIDADMKSDGNVVSDAWIPSGFLSMPTSEVFNPFIDISASEDKIIFSGLSKDVTVNSIGRGIEFELSSGFRDEIISTSSRCEQDNLSGSIISIYSSKQCQSAFEINFDKNIAPFRFFRPIIDLENIVDDFKVADAPKGDYIAIVPITFGFNYVQKSSGVPTYIIFNDVLEIRIKYTPVILTSVDVSGSGELKIEYDTSDHTASGISKFNVMAKGIFNPGLKLTFRSDGKDDEFRLYNKESRTFIPYNISCKLCTIENPVIDGKVNLDGETYINVIGNFISFNLYAYFKDVSFHDVEGGIYKDNLMILFEVDI
ncbi:hypothetical protein NGM67_03295 [Photobacterium damselae]|uniref:hypothetical protein n=1 Tax=Photobacterium damselae TaxID=38293 RepID=UPI0020912C5E|nr:hypothetical protein [Photobacterium damselae]USR75074.1 hypothetical protein NGM67_03295 [Photobacterium damselae]